MRCNPSRWLWGLIPIAMLSWGTYYRERPHVEADLTQRALEALRTAGQPWAKVTLTGRDAVITGRARKDGEPKAALDAVRSVWGIRTVQLKTDLAGVAAAPEGIGPRAAANKDAGTEAHRDKQEAERKAKGDAEAAARKAKHEADLAALKAQEEARAKEKAEAERTAKLQAEAEADADARRAEAAAQKAREEAEAARKAKDHAEAQAAQRAREQTEAALKAQHEAEAVLKAQEAEAAAVLKAKDDQEAAARRRAEMDAAAAARKAHEESEARKTREAAAQKAKADAEAAAALRAKKEAEAARKAEEEATAAQKAKQEADMAAEAKAEAEAEKRAEAERARKTTAETQACEKRLTTAAGEGVILFKRASADIDPKSSMTIARLAEIIKRCPGARVEVEGHTDAEGEPDRNQRLSERRARAVVSSLTLAGVAADHLSAVGYGATRPVAPNDTAQGMARNRRIEFKVFSD